MKKPRKDVTVETTNPYKVARLRAAEHDASLNRSHYPACAVNPYTP
jgi:hypothetical protein